MREANCESSYIHEMSSTLQIMEFGIIVSSPPQIALTAPHYSYPWAELGERVGGFVPPPRRPKIHKFELKSRNMVIQCCVYSVKYATFPCAYGTNSTKDDKPKRRMKKNCQFFNGVAIIDC